MPPSAQHPTHAYPLIYPTIDHALQTPPSSQHDTQGLNGYMISHSPRPLPDPSQVSRGQHQQNRLSDIPVPQYPDYSLPYQNNAQSPQQGYEKSMGGRMGSPQKPNSPKNPRTRGVVPEIAERRICIASAGAHRGSVGSAGNGAGPQRNGSMDGSDVASPISSRGTGGRGSDESVPQTESIDSKDGIDVTPNKSANKDEPPPWSELKTKAGKERKRLPLACIACRRKKIRCSGEKPACKHCLRSRIPCVYKITTRKAAPRTDYMAMLDKRLKRMEERVIKIIPDQDAGKLAHIGRANVKPGVTQPLKAPGVKKRVADEAFGNELDEWAHVAVNKPTGHSRPSTAIDKSESRLLVEGIESLPSKEIQEHLSEVFFDCLYGQSYHVLHKPSFMRRLRAGTVPPVLILAVCAIAARFSTHPQLSTDPAFLRGESWAKPARDIALKRYDEPNITILTVFLILGLHEFGTCQGGRSWMLGGMAIRMAYALQLHKELDHEPGGGKQDEASELSYTDREIRRRTMWACFLMDRFNSSGTQRPLFADEEHIEVQLPIKESHFQMEIPGPTESLDGGVPNPVTPGAGQVSDPKDNMGVAAYLIRVIALWGRVVKYLNLGGKRRDSHPLWHPGSHFAELKRQAETFHASLPECLKYTAENLQTHAAEKLANQFLFLHVAYNQVMLFLHNFAIPASPGGRIPKEMPKDFVNDSAQTALEAASQISALLNETTNHLVAAPFAGYCAFVSSTVHIWGVFSKNPQLEASSKRNLAYNVKYLGMMKKYWGMFHYMAENLKDIYRQHADVALKGPNNGSAKQDASIFQYGDWFNKYPHGVSETDYEDPAADVKKESGNDAALSQKPDLQSVEEFFSTLSAPPSIATQRKASKRHGRTTHHDQQQIQQSINVKAESPIAHQHNPSHHQALLNMPIHHPQHPSDPSAYTATLYTPSHPTFPPNFDSNLLPMYQSLPVQDLDRQLVFDAYAGTDPTAPSPSSNLNANTSGIGGLWDTQMDFTHLGVEGGYGDLNSNAWFMPFNLHPPDVGADGEFVGLDGFGVDGIVGEGRMSQ